MITLIVHKDGLLLPVRAKPGAKVDELVDLREGTLRVRVTAAPEAGKANEAIARLLADTLQLRRSQVALHSGASSRNKRFLFTDITAEDLAARITGVLESTEPDGQDASS